MLYLRVGLKHGEYIVKRMQYSSHCNHFECGIDRIESIRLSTLSCSFTYTTHSTKGSPAVNLGCGMKLCQGLDVGYKPPRETLPQSSADVAAR